MILAVPKEAGPDSRVALIPADVRKVVKAGLEVFVESGAGAASYYADDVYKKEGAKLSAGVKGLLKKSDIVLRVSNVKKSDADSMKAGAVLIALLNPLQNLKVVKTLAKKRVTSFAMEFIPRIGRAQSMDALSSQASIAGYKSVLLAAAKLTKLFPMMTTAAGTITPARVLVIGVGVAGLQAIATARRLGAVVEAFDIRPQTRQEVESLGAKFIEIKLEETTEAAGGYAKEVSEAAKKKEHEILSQHISRADVVITAAQVPGRKAPLLLTQQMAAAMKNGSVIVDLAAESGGNCALTKPGKEISYNGVTVMGPVNLPSTVPQHASQMYSRNISGFLLSMLKDGKLNIDLNEEIVKNCLVTYDGQVVNENVRKIL